MLVQMPLKLKGPAVSPSDSFVFNSALSDMAAVQFKAYEEIRIRLFMASQIFGFLFFSLGHLEYFRVCSYECRK